jgi:hypothetical protein
MSTSDSPGGEGGRCVRLTTYHPCSAERQEIRGLNLPETSVGLLGLSVGVNFTFYQLKMLRYLHVVEVCFFCTDLRKKQLLLLHAALIVLHVSVRKIAKSDY